MKDPIPSKLTRLQALRDQKVLIDQQILRLGDEIRSECTHPDFAVTRTTDTLHEGDEWSRNERSYYVHNFYCTICGESWHQE